MSKRTVSISFFIVLLFVLLLPFEGISNKIDRKSKALSDNEMQWRIENLVGPIDYRYTSKVRSEVESYIFDYPKGAEELLGRVTIYFPLFEEKLAEKQLPVELKYLSVIESSLKADAYSRVGAAGLWQFMSGTAREYGLTVSKSFDQRYEVEKATEAAFEYLSVLYDQFDDWTLALAAYNCGPGNVRKAMRRSGKKDYWGIRNYLPKETRNYIPKLVAATYVIEYFEEHNLMPVKPESFYYGTAEANVFQHLSFEEISRITGLSKSIISQLNPSFRKHYIPANTKGMRLVLPKNAMYSLIRDENTHQLNLINKKNISVNQYIRSNFNPEIASYLLIDIHEKIEIAPIEKKLYQWKPNENPVSEQTNIPDATIRTIRNRRNTDDSIAYVLHRLKMGETLRDVLKQYPNSDFQSILRENNIRLNQSPHPGTLLKVMTK